jgi:hypothetical protein
MMGLAFIGVFLVYLVVSWGVVFAAAVWAKKRGRRPLLWGGLAFLLMYNLVFWDLIPTYVVFKYKSATESGFWVYKTPEQWKEENPGVAETLTRVPKTEQYSSPGITRGFKLNDRFTWVFIENKTPIIPVFTQQEMIVDLKTNEPMVERVIIYSGYGGGSGLIMFWVYHRQPSFKVEEFRALRTGFKRIGGTASE